ncbi:DUF4025 domain-containing protein [Neobacillus piezotolerans]|uniref:DUF4025 domain-containing protein n=2 Tax=Neobacillus piezotolerans TaxID=2259171 RepID=A0A3D8GSN2_9BACI|nr:YozQ family protein [Neobacillus piezotolerans]RDU37219.1 DUF4025 domain-containing protein [Neobacillus piezotolerans]
MKMDKRERGIAGRIYDPSDYKKQDEVSAGLAETHEQASDVYMEGEIGGRIERPDGSDEDLPR